MRTCATGSQTVGPFFHLGLADFYRENLVSTGAPGEKISIRGRVLDADGEGVNDAMLEIWQADSQGNFHETKESAEKSEAAGFWGFGRIATNSDGRFHFTTVKPGRVPGAGGAIQAPHIVVTIFMRGLLKQLTTRIYFPGEPANEEDAVLRLVPPARRATLIAARAAENSGELEWNVILQGAKETVFFDC
ncbi:MAG TPA: protocatechuate 3,4-dioxygenase subunit alpha [Candidatus Acidoferrales bacterium]|jgi:protocatechuate 3,4-dioxygenase alpha subunit